MIEEHAGLLVQRDDLLPGGSKSRFVPAMFEGYPEVVYASPVQDGKMHDTILAALRGEE